MITQLLPTGGVDLDPITSTWLRGLIATALERRIRPLCWHIEQEGDNVVATGYVTVTLQHEAPEIRRSWAAELELARADDHEQAASYEGSAGTLTIRLPNEIDPDEHCRICNRPFDPRENGGARHEGGDVCQSCTAQQRDLNCQPVNP